MSPTHSDRNASGELHTFERNRYFHGKLMTARDMLAEQDYHGDRLSATNRYVAGEGVVCGVDVPDGGLVEEDGRLSATLTPGFALDGFGDPVVVTGGSPVVVKDPGTNQPGVPSGEPPVDIDLYLRYDECDVETVPRPGSENACEEECTYNRILEVFDVVFESVDDRDVAVEDEPDLVFPKGYKPVRDVRFPDPDAVTEDEEGRVRFDDPGLMVIARDYYARHLSECRNGSESWVFLGTFTDPDGDGNWAEVEPEEGLSHGSLVYTNDMLYAAIARHTADFHNPHGVTLDVTDGAGDASVRIVDDDSPGGAVGVSSDATIDVTGTARSGETPSSVDFGVNVDELSARIEAVRNIEGATPDADGRIDLVGTGAVDITQEPGSNGITFDVPEVDAIERIGNATPTDGRVDINGTQGVTVTTSDSQITVRGPGTPEVPEIPDLDVLVRATVRRSITCKFVSYSAAGERLSNVDGGASEIMDEIAAVAREFVEGEAFDAEQYLEFIEQIFGMEDRLNETLQELAGEVYTELSVERYGVAFEQLARVLEELGRDEESVPEIAAAQDCLTRAAEALRPLGRQIG